MTDDIIEQITPHIHEILRIMLVKGRTLRAECLRAGTFEGKIPCPVRSLAYQVYNNTPLPNPTPLHPKIK
jgi:hypothetical protein